MIKYVMNAVGLFACTTPKHGAGCASCIGGRERKFDDMNESFLERHQRGES